MPSIKVRDNGRVERLIAISYFLSTKSEIHIDELCERVNVDRKQLEADLNVLMFCGLPPYSPEQLFDIIIEDDFVSMYFNDVFLTPLRLTEEEKAHIMIGLSRLKAQSTSADEAAAIDEVVSMIDSAAGDLVVVEASASMFDSLILEAIESKSVLEITYLSLNSSNIANRLIDPKVFYSTASISYVFAFDHTSESFRMFRSDRILDAKLSTKARPLATNTQIESSVEADSTQVFVEQRDSFVDLEIDAKAQWILDSYPHESVDTTKGIYRFYTPTAFFPARLIISNLPLVKYVGGTFHKSDIALALDKIEDQMNKQRTGSK